MEDCQLSHGPVCRSKGVLQLARYPPSFFFFFFFFFVFFFFFFLCAPTAGPFTTLHRPTRRTGHAKPRNATWKLTETNRKLPGQLRDTGRASQERRKDEWVWGGGGGGEEGGGGSQGLVFVLVLCPSLGGGWGGSSSFLLFGGVVVFPWWWGWGFGGGGCGGGGSFRFPGFFLFLGGWGGGRGGGRAILRALTDGQSTPASLTQRGRVPAKSCCRR